MSHLDQDNFRQKYRELLPLWQDSQSLYKQYISEKVRENSKILDIGCGHSILLKGIIDKSSYTYGIDPDGRAIERNKLIHNKTVGKADKLPYQSNFFDLVVSTWVLEHISNPQQVIKEVYRVLKPGGSFIFITPNVLNYYFWFTKLIPQNFHDRLARWLYKRQEKDTFNKYYLFNKPADIKNIATKVGFKIENLIVNGDPTYISFNNSLFWLACKLEILINKYLPQQKIHIIGILRK